MTYGSHESPANVSPAYIVQQASASSLIKEFNITAANTGPNAIVSGLNQVFWFTEFTAGKIGEFISQTNTFKEFQINETGANPATLALDSMGRIWFSDQNVPSIWVLNTTSGQFHRYLTNSPNSTPVFVLVDRADNVWFTDTGANSLGKVAPSGQISRYPLPTPNSGPAGLATQNGTSYLWIAEGFAGKIARFDTGSGTFQEFTPSISLKYPVGIVVDHAGYVWVSEHGGSSVAELIPSNATFRKYPTAQPVGVPGTGPATLALDKLGRMWFVEHYSNKVGRIDPSTGTVDEFVIPVQGAYSLLDTVDSSGNFWFTQFFANKIGMIPSNATSPFGLSTKSVPVSRVSAGQTVSYQISITNTSPSQVALSLGVTSSFTPNATTTSSEMSLSNYALTLNPGQTDTVTAIVTPDLSLPSATYSAGLVATFGTSSSAVIVFLQVQGSLLYTLETYLPAIVAVAAAILVLTFFLVKRRRSSHRLTSSAPKVNTFLRTMLVSAVFTIQMIGSANAKCPGLPQPPVNPNGTGPDYYGIALDVGSIAFFGIVAYFIVRSRLQKGKSREGE
jgi:virginiamycin B lyase